MHENTHWNLIYINIKTNSFFPINPYHHLNPNKNAVEIGMNITASFSVCFKREQITCEAPATVKNFPSQSDTQNCGIYVILFSLALFERNLNSKEKMYQYSIDAYGLIKTAWLMTKERLFLVYHNFFFPQKSGNKISKRFFMFHSYPGMYRYRPLVAPTV